MSQRIADLHIHTHFSDGTMSPEEVVAAAKEAGLAAIGIADHDTIDGIAPAKAAADLVGLEVVPGVELSSEYHGKDIHILGYFFDLKDSPLVRLLGNIQLGRMDRMRKMVSKLNQMGVKDIAFDEVCGQLKSDSVGRLHLAKLLVARGHVPSLNAAFEKYLGEGAPAYYPKFKQTPIEAIKLIKDSGGISVLAHPMLTQKDELIPEFVRAGLDGIEAYYPNCSMEVANFYVGIAQKHGILISGGSDAHGKGKDSTWIGKAYLPYEHVEKMKEWLRR
ncbi:MAG: PHP domain-containing protein [Candidatus Omnitrophica bacterium]|nr:PHP domain-containing protein [Candidatus Omnitrophota bacterium]